jgi:hypothetical protein
LGRYGDAQSTNLWARKRKVSKVKLTTQCFKLERK